MYCRNRDLWDISSIFDKCLDRLEWTILVEPVCCKKQQKRVPGQLLACEIGNHGIKLILDDQENHLDSYAISLESFRSFRGRLFRKPVTRQELFFCFLQPNDSNLKMIVPQSTSKKLVEDWFCDVLFCSFWSCLKVWVYHMDRA